MAEKTIQLEIDRITVDEELQSRVTLSPATVEEYAERVAAGEELPPVVVFREGDVSLLASGFHRRLAYLQAGRRYIPAVVRPGGRREALLFSLSCNATHGLRRTASDVRRSVYRMLEDREWCSWPSESIARHLKVNADLVATLREQLAQAPLLPGLLDEGEEQPPKPVHVGNNGVEPEVVQRQLARAFRRWMRLTGKLGEDPLEYFRRMLAEAGEKKSGEEN